MATNNPTKKARKNTFMDWFVLVSWKLSGIKDDCSPITEKQFAKMTFFQGYMVILSMPTLALILWAILAILGIE